MLELRELNRFSREDLARRGHVEYDLIARIELQRAPMRYRDARQLLPALTPDRSGLKPISPLWLAEDIGPIQLDWPLLLPDPQAIGLNPNITFSDFVAGHHELLTALSKYPPEAELPESWLAPYALHFSGMSAQSDRFQTAVSVLKYLFLFSAQRLAKESPQAAALVREFEQAERSIGKGRLTRPSDSRNTENVKSELQNLLDEVRHFVEARGAKAKLAAYLGVPHPRVSEWLNGKYEPSGDNTLKLLHWVEHQREQQKSPGTALTAPERKTRLRKSNDEKPKSSQRG